VTSAALLSGAVLLFGAAPANPLTQLDAALKALTARVSPAVVQVLVTGYGPAPSRSAGDAVLYTRQQGLGSGVVLDPSGYIITNAHVVKGAERVQVVFTKPDRSARAVPPVDEEAVLPATVVGLTEYFDLALLKVEATGLPSLPFADFHTVTQGQVVVAVGSPLGLDNSVTMGVVSSVARQARPDSPIVYVQTDAPINPGNSGGALVDVEGRLVGINTLILSQTGGNEGLGFALPAPIVELAYDSLRKKGHVDRRILGVAVQRITPTLAAGLGLPRAQGLVVCDLESGGPGEAAGLKIGDVILEADGRPVTVPPQLDGAIYLHDVTRPMPLAVLHEGVRTTVEVRVTEETHRADSVIDPTDPQRNLVPQIGVMAVAVTPEMQGSLGTLRIPGGVAVVARTTDVSGVDLVAGDVIHAVNGTAVGDVDALRDALALRKHGDPVVLQVERQGGLQFVGYEVD